MKTLFNYLCLITKKYPARLTSSEDLKALLTRLKPQKCDKELIRVGPKGDGGYLLPDDLEGVTACFSPGVDYTSGFEKDCAQREMDIFMADYSVDGPATEDKRFHFIKKYLGAIKSTNVVTLNDWVKASIPDSTSELILQMDIEGAEYEVLLGASESLLKRFRIIVIEFHSLKDLWNKPFFNLASRVFDKLLQTHVCIHNHPNNCNTSKKIGPIEMPSVTEMTFIRKDRVNELSDATTFPHPLDSDNSNKRSMTLPKCWYK